MPPEFEILSKEELAAKLVNVQFENFELKNRLAWFERQIFGTKSERYISEDVNQLSLDLGITSSNEPGTAPELENISYQRRKKKEKPSERKAARMPLPAHLRREETILLPEGDLSDKVEIGEEVTEYLEEKVGEVYVIRIVRKIYATRKNPDAGIITAALPERAFPKFNIGANMLALILIRKYIDHLPIHRQNKIYKRQALILAESTIHGWVKAGIEMITIVYDRMMEILISRTYLQSDDTGFKVMEEKGDRKTLLGYMWVYQDPVDGLVLFEYSPRRNKVSPDRVLENYRGYLQCDGTSHYKSFEKNNGVVLLNCWAHARRKFEASLDNDFEKADWMMRKIQELYEIERIARENQFTHEQRYEIRQEKSIPVLQEIKTWLIQKLQEGTLPKSVIGNAINYTLSRMDNLSFYCEDGRLEIDNNLAENSIRPIVLGRKNFLFAVTHESAQRAAVIYSLTATCKFHKINPEEYFPDIMNRIGSHPINRLDELLPWNWKKLRDSSTTE